MPQPRNALSDLGLHTQLASSSFSFSWQVLDTILSKPSLSHSHIILASILVHVVITVHLIDLITFHVLHLGVEPLILVVVVGRGVFHHAVH